ncbi:MAG: hemerythrin domain-containing protein [Candidatus Acidulodesulfobacterium sp.]
MKTYTENDTELNPLDALREEHTEMRTVLNKFENILKKIPAGVSDSELNEISEYLNQDVELHFKREEDALFPVLGNYIGIETGPINVMLIEHNSCRELTGDLKKRIEGKDYKSIASSGKTLIELLSEHEDKEDGILFQIAEMQLGQNEKQDIMKKLIEIN